VLKRLTMFEGRRASQRRQTATVLLLAFAVRATSLISQGLWRDEVDQWRFAFLPLSEMVSNLTRPGWNGPLYSIALRGWIALAGESIYAMRYLSVVGGLLSLALGYAVIRRLCGRHVALLTLWLATLSPYLVWYAQEIKMYTWVPMLVLLALYAIDRACVAPRAGWWLVVFLATTFAVYSHILAALLIPVLGIWFWLHPRRVSRAWIGGLAVAAGLTLPYLPLLRWQAALALVPRETGFPRYSLGQMAKMLLNGWSLGVSQGSWGTRDVLMSVMALYGGLAVLGLVFSHRVVSDRCVKSAHRRKPPVWQRSVRAFYDGPGLRLLAWLVLPLLAIWLVSLRGPIFTDRYLIWSASAFYTLVASGVIWLLRRHVHLAWLVIGVMTTFSAHGLWVQATEPIKPQFERGAAIVDAQWVARDLLLFQIPYNRLVYEVYSEAGRDAWAEAPYTNWRDPNGTYLVDPTNMGREMRSLVTNHDRVWLIYSEVALWDDRELAKGWLDETYELVDAVHFTGVSVLLYVRPMR
jgi:mannosyltransferase